ncbi:tail fiber protein [Massilia sp. H-1]|nr:tail fiber protein [Massilia sp. H-1]
MYMGMIFPVAFNYAPQGTLMCAGQLLSIAQNSALFSLLGTTYGGDGQSTFALPDLRGRMPIAPSTGVGGRIDSSLGSVGGTPNVTAILNGTGTANVALTVANLLRPHNHNATFTPGGGGGATVTLNASTDLATTSQ